MNFLKRFFICSILMLCTSLTYGCKSELQSNKTNTNAKDNKVITAALVNTYQADGQVRDNIVDLNKYKVGALFLDDPVFKEFKDTEISYKDYEQFLFNEAKNKGIDATKLRNAMEKAKILKSNSTMMYPVIIDTAKYDNKDCFIFVFTWELKDVVKEEKTVKPLGHIFIAAIEADTQNVIAQESCR